VRREAGVQWVERWIRARLRHQSLLSLPELNAAIRTLLEELNTRPFKKLPGSRRTLFETLDRPAMQPLPPQRYVLGPSGASRGCTSTTMSRPTATITRYPTRW
jgi:hypothetical protein